MDDDGLLMNFAAPQPVSRASRTQVRKGAAQSRAIRSGAPHAKRQSNGDASMSSDTSVLASQSWAQHAASSSASAPPSTSLAAHPPFSSRPDQPALKRPRLSDAGGSVRANGLSAEHDISDLSERPGRRRIKTAAAASASARPQGSQLGSGAGRPGGGSGAGIVSSLFTGDASSGPNGHTFAEGTTPVRNARPTNAPLDSSTFSGLALDPLIVRHLSGRMDIGSRPTAIQRTALPALMSSSSSSEAFPTYDKATAKDVLIHAQTGSGKTLAYLLPILQSLLPLCADAASWIDRNVGTLAIVLAPTRELARQIYEVAEKLLALHLSARSGDRTDDREAAAMAGEEAVEGVQDPSRRRTRWIVPGLLSGGSTKNHEKSKLRKGLPIIVATPGRLLDHLQNTSTLDVGRLQWLVLDEADRLLEMGFKETLDAILRALDGRRRLARETARNVMLENGGAANDEPTDAMGIQWWKAPRRTVLCSATLDENVQVLAGTALVTPIVVRALADGYEPKDASAPLAIRSVSTSSEADLVAIAKTEAQPQATLSAPAQLRQHFVITPTKQRLVMLLALLRKAISSATSTDGTPAATRRVIVFMSCTDSVDLHWNAMGGVNMDTQDGAEERSTTESDAGTPNSIVGQTCQLLPDARVYRLHGSMPQADRILSLRTFSKNAPSNGGACKASILLCTSVAARGLDLPDVGTVIQLDPPTDSGADEYLHRIGRTARAGRNGQSWLMLLPHEREIVSRLEENMRSGDAKFKDAQKHLHEADPRSTLRNGFGGRGDEYEARATDAQLAFERWVMSSEKASTMARSAFMSHIRAYATHPASNKDIFSIGALQLGHLAKAFALREAPATIKAKARSSGSASKLNTSKKRKLEVKEEAHRKDKIQKMQQKAQDLAKSGREDARDGPREEEEEDSDDPAAFARSAARKHARHSLPKADAPTKDVPTNSAEARMYAKVRALGRETRKGGVLGAHAADEFQLG
ncbi:dead-domain-containing protein [Ceraceosorus bombacis]|uniref:ATP-dependent RNA helicase n=1 Tax=Ceraceosorus bombacis TaxID=401625 RepID=A0A0P1BEU3_9BASI|nr:dead-domain-containing protein [Ceraceosorus bombacis]